MPIEITMPRLSDTMEVGTILHWHVNVGDEVSAGDLLADIETDKATMELQSFDDGRVAELVISEGNQVDVGTVIAMLAEDDEAIVEETPEKPKPSIPKVTESAHRVSPVARRLAEEYGVDLLSVQGSGPSGRIIKRDILQLIDTASETTAAAQTTKVVPAEVVPSTVPVTPVQQVLPLAPTSPWQQNRSEPLSNMRQIIASRLVESKQTIPHYQVTMTFDMDPLLEMRKTLNEQLSKSGVKLSVNDFLVRCCALSMETNPEFNASFGGDCIHYHGPVNVGIAIALPEERGGGLVVGTIRNADQKSLRTISQESAYLSNKARETGLSPEEMGDTTFTISNLGMFGVDNFTAIINPPNSAILAVGAAIEKPVVRGGELVVGNEMSATLSLDHRVIDGAMAALYLKTLKELIENPASLLV
ncbi:MAG: 2-oxo acid dehydrogenase subunit E2 [Phycisphaerales bacterium]|nr:2-oxo acid dehydrogenase subunit E2 [Planctomycetota bacterium]MBL6997474.1 2-oxo acid dehydrogenase subunit E2 [Phycisphaerales bacterium]